MASWMDEDIALAVAGSQAAAEPASIATQAEAEKPAKVKEATKEEVRRAGDDDAKDRQRRRSEAQRAMKLSEKHGRRHSGESSGNARLKRGAAISERVWARLDDKERAAAVQKGALPPYKAQRKKKQQQRQQQQRQQQQRQERQRQPPPAAEDKEGDDNDHQAKSAGAAAVSEAAGNAPSSPPLAPLLAPPLVAALPPPPPPPPPPPTAAFSAASLRPKTQQFSPAASMPQRVGSVEDHERQTRWSARLRASDLASGNAFARLPHNFFRGLVATPGRFIPHPRKKNRDIKDAHDIRDYYRCSLEHSEDGGSGGGGGGGGEATVAAAAAAGGNGGGREANKGDDSAEEEPPAADDSNAALDILAAACEHAYPMLPSWILGEPILGGRALYLGGYSAATNHKWLWELNVVGIVNAAKGLDLFPTYQEHVAELEGGCSGKHPAMRFLHLGLDDSLGEELSPDLVVNAVRFIHSCLRPHPISGAAGESCGGRQGDGANESGANDSAAGSVLVHCASGRSRSAAIVVAYVAASRGITIAEALTLVKAGRRIAKPNDNFLRQLEAMWREVLLPLQEELACGTKS